MVVNRRYEFYTSGSATQPPAYHTVAVEIDVDLVARLLGGRAVRSKGKKATAMKGAIKVIRVRTDEVKS